jgi:succinate-semialdehyde dehydrogenase/glutarate-semialdehyde dehydrogenase
LKRCVANISQYYISFQIEQLVDDAKNKGAKIVCGGARRDSKVGNFFEPTIITNIQQNMTIAQTEIFGPVVAIARYID